MRNKILILFFLLLAINVFGQDVTDSTSVGETGRKNVLKFLPTNLIFNSLSFEYERKLGKKNSIILGIGLPSSKSFAGKFTDNSGENKITNDAFSTMSLRLAYRHYSGKSIQPSGFYVSPYLKYQKFEVSADNNKTVTQGYPPITQNYTEKYDVSGSTMNLGLQLGVQFLIAKRVAVDFYFLGIEAGLANLNASVKSSNINMIDEVETSVRDNIKDLPDFLAKKITVTRKSNDQIDVKGDSMPYPWIRGGISIGIAF